VTFSLFWLLVLSLPKLNDLKRKVTLKPYLATKQIFSSPNQLKIVFRKVKESVWHSLLPPPLKCKLLFEWPLKTLFFGISQFETSTKRNLWYKRYFCSFYLSSSSSPQYPLNFLLLLQLLSYSSKSIFSHYHQTGVPRPSIDNFVISNNFADIAKDFPRFHLLLCARLWSLMRRWSILNDQKNNW